MPTPKKKPQPRKTPSKTAKKPTAKRAPAKTPRKAAKKPAAKRASAKTTAAKRTAATKPAAKKAPAKRRTSKSATKRAPVARPTQDEIRNRAGQIWVESGQRMGSALADWVRAEKELYTERGLKL